MTEDYRMVLSSDHQIGRRDAAVTLIEYGDYQCPFCKAASPIVEALRKTFKDDLLFAYRHFPLTQIHEWARIAAQTAEAAGRQGKFWDMHRLLFKHEGPFTENELLRYAKMLDLDVKRLVDDIEDESVSLKIKRDFMSGVKLGISGTPGFIINGEVFAGDWMHGDLESAIEMFGSGRGSSLQT